MSEQPINDAADVKREAEKPEWVSESEWEWMRSAPEGRKRELWRDFGTRKVRRREEPCR